MYSKIENGRITDVQGLPCCIPPDGYVYNIVSKKLEYRGIHKRSEFEKEQYWERIQPPNWYASVMKEWDAYDKNKKDGDVEFYDERLEEYKRQEWDRRLNGFWFMNNGQPVYLTGSHYMYLQWWIIDIGYPKYRLPDLEYFYFLQYVIEDPNCMGMLEITKRRFGKTYRGGLFVTEYPTRTKMTNGTIQSKTSKDAKKVFTKAVVNPFRRLPKFFRPVYDTSLGVNPSSEMRFQRTNVKGKKADENIYDDELGSIIDHHSSDPLSQDGMKVHRGLQDEWAKTIECDIYERHEVMRYCVVDDENQIIGKLLYTSTVEKLKTDKEGVQEGAKNLWVESDQLNKSENGRTISGLYRFFLSAKKARNFDIYGIPDEEKTLKQILADRETVKNNHRSLLARMRKEPLTWQEAFSEDDEKCVFNLHNIQNREEFLLTNNVPKRSVVYYRDGETLKVKWRDAKKTELDFCWKMTKLLPEDDSNKYIILDGSRSPNNIKLGAMSVDSYSNSQGGRKYGSKASAWLGVWENGRKRAIGHLYGRPDYKEQLHEQVLLAAEYWGLKVWYEHTSDDYLGYYRDRGRVNYLGIYPLHLIQPEKRNDAERFRGTPITPFSLTKQLDTSILYFEKDCDLIDFEELLLNSKKFDPYDRTAYDTVVSFLIWCSVMEDKPHIPPPKKNPIVQVYAA